MTIDTSNEVSPRPASVGRAGDRPFGLPTRVAGVPVPALAVVGGVVAFFALHPFDDSVGRALDGLKLSGDIRREWEALQQFGQGVSIAILALVIFLLDRAPGRRARLLDWGLALAAVGLVVLAMKCLIGRPRPKFGDSGTFLFPGGTYPVPLKDGTVVNAHAWDFSVPTHAQLWSMPSSHTALAVVTAVFLAAMYPRLRFLVAALAIAVAGGRLVFDAHWLTDVTTAIAVAVAVGWPVIGGGALSRKCQTSNGPIAKYD